MGDIENMQLEGEFVQPMIYKVTNPTKLEIEYGVLQKRNQFTEEYIIKNTNLSSAGYTHQVYTRHHFWLDLLMINHFPQAHEMWNENIREIIDHFWNVDASILNKKQREAREEEQKEQKEKPKTKQQRARTQKAIQFKVLYYSICVSVNLQIC